MWRVMGPTAGNGNSLDSGLAVVVLATGIEGPGLGMLWHW